MSWYNPVDWWNATIGAAAGQVSDAIQQWVMDAIQSAIGLVENDVHDVLGWAENGISAVENEAYSLYGSAVQEIGAVEGWAQSAIGAAVQEGRTLFSEAEQAATAGLHAVESEAVNLWHTAERDIVRGLGAVRGWAEQTFTAVERWVSKEIAAAWHSVYSAVKRDFIDPIERVLNPVIKAMEWILWMGEHPFRVFHDVEHDLIDWAEHLPTEIRHVIKSHSFAQGFDDVARMLGG